MNNNRGEIWCGETWRMPKVRPSEDIIAMPTINTIDDGALEVDLCGVVNFNAWQRFAATLDLAVDRQPRRLVITIDSLCQTAKGAGLAVEAIGRATLSVFTEVHLHDSAGIALMVGQGVDRFVMVNGCFFNSSSRAEVLYGHSTGLPKTEHIGLFCGRISGTAERISHESIDDGKLTADELHKVLNHLFSKEEPSHAN